MSYLMFWPTFSTSGSARIGRSAVERRRAASSDACRGSARGPAGNRPRPAFQLNDRPDEVGPERVEGGRLGVDAEPGLSLQLGEEGLRTARAYRRGGSRRPRPGRRGVGLGRAELVEEPVEAALDAERLEAPRVGRRWSSARPSRARAAGRSRRVTSFRARRAVSACSRRLCCFLGPLTWSTLASRLSSVPNSSRNVAANPQADARARPGRCRPSRR